MPHQGFSDFEGVVTGVADDLGEISTEISDQTENLEIEALMIAQAGQPNASWKSILHETKAMRDLQGRVDKCVVSLGGPSQDLPKTPEEARLRGLVLFYKDGVPNVIPMKKDTV